MNSTDDKIERLPKEVKVLKRLVLALCLALMFTFLVAASPPISDTVKARSLEIVDPHGVSVVQIGSSESGGYIHLNNNSGRSTFTTYVLPGGSGALWLWDKNSKPIFKKQGQR